MSPSPTPILVQIVSQEPPPVWLGPLLTGGFVLLAAFIALLSLRWSDLRKLAREDRRQWDAELKIAYVRIGEHVRAVRTVLARNEGSADYAAKILSTTDEAMRGVREHIRLFELIAPPEVTKAAEDVSNRLSAIWRRTFLDTTRDQFKLKWAAEESEKLPELLDALRDRIRASLRV